MSKFVEGHLFICSFDYYTIDVWMEISYRWMAENTQQTKSPVTENQTSDHMRNTRSCFIYFIVYKYVYYITLCAIVYCYFIVVNWTQQSSIIKSRINEYNTIHVYFYNTFSFKQESDCLHCLPFPHSLLIQDFKFFNKFFKYSLKKNSYSSILGSQNNKYFF